MKSSEYYGLTGLIVTPEDPEYNELRQEWNRAIQKFPLALVYCYNKEDVANAVFWCSVFFVSLRIRNGGHNYEGYSTGNGVLVIDTSFLNHIEIEGEQVYVEGGVKNREFYNYLGAQGYPFPSGTCPTVGVSGLVLGGGWGLSCRKFGLTCDSLSELELVNYEGKIIKASCDKNHDLFWACRGAGGGNFGVIVSMKFRLPPKTEYVTYVEIYFPNTSLEIQTQFFRVWQSWLKDADESMSLIASIYHSKTDGFAVYGRGICYGTPEDAEFILMPFMSIPGFRLNTEYLTFVEAINKIEDSYPRYERFKSVGRFVVYPLSMQQMSTLTRFIRNVPPGSVYSSVSLYSLGGKVADVPEHKTAFYYRKAQYICLIQSVWEEDEFQEVNTDWVEERAAYLRDITQGSYINFPDSGLNFPDSGLKNYMKAYYGGNAKYLYKVKRKYDPLTFIFPKAYLTLFVNYKKNGLSIRQSVYSIRLITQTVYQGRFRQESHRRF